ncbi:MAG: tRNA 4-thiouridine(8) synthase ThiI [Clostridia bacterium]|nr:tRNA 4-thiouridine(8) synthase ThiI [Clostridia bacterium]MBQ6960146.1 tRNA 4-thiouridine(8) synthase ThiI [Clostridia bacterium]
MRKLLMVRYGEIYLKGLNRPYFLKALVRRVKEAARPFGAQVWLHDARIFISDAADLDGCMQRVAKVFGVHSIAPAIEMEKDNFEGICEQANELMQGLSGTFKVEARRADKHYFLDSPQINAKVGEYVLMRSEDRLKVDVRKPQHILSIEIRDQAYLYCTVYPAVGGMPVGTGGKAALLLSGGIDSPVAGYMIAKRGVQLVAVHYHSFPYTSEFAKQKVLDLAKILSEYCCGIRVYVVPFTDIQMKIHEKCPEDYTTLIMRRYMMRIAERIAQKEEAMALITGESIGQVASQTMEALITTNEVVETMPVYRPLIGFDKIDIMEYAKKIGTYDTSILPYEDCCTVFTPRHPATKPKEALIKKGEEQLDQEALIQTAIENAEIVEL